MATVSSVAKSKITGAIVGAFAADAACMGLHWIYSQEKVKELLAVDGGKDPLFYDPPSSPFYTHSQGDSTPYGAQAQPFVTAVAAAGWDPKAAEAEFLKWADGFAGYKSGLVKKIVANKEAGKEYPDTAPDNDDFDCVIKGILGACVFAGKPDMLDQVEAMVRVTQNNDAAVMFGKGVAQFLEHILLGASVEETIEWVISNRDSMHSMGVWMRLAGALKTGRTVDHSDAIALVGPACALPGGFLGAAHAVASSPTDLVAALRATITAGGESGTRSLFIGAVLGASAGIEGVPADLTSKCGPWMETMRKGAEAIAEAHGV